MSPSEEHNRWLESHGTSALSAGVRMVDLLRRPQLDMRTLIGGFPKLAQYVDSIDEDLRDEVVEAAEILIKYDGYIRRERELAEKTLRLEDVRLRDEIDYFSITSLSTEARQKLDGIRPATIGQASRIPGVSPADVQILLMMCGR